MKFQFGKTSKLYGREVFNSVDRISYVPKSEEGLKEYILVYNNQVPTKEEEPDLYEGANVNVESDGTTILDYNIDEIVLLLTIAADDEYRKEKPDLAGQEIMRIDK